MLIRLVSDTLLDRRCPGCGRRTGHVCEGCRATLRLAPAATPPSGVLAPLVFDGVVRRLIIGLKYQRRLGVVGVLADLLEREVQRGPHHINPHVKPHINLVTWAPTTSRRRRQRGADQAELLARALARRLGVPCRRLLRKIDGPAQTGLGRSERLRGPSFVARPLLGAPWVLVVDDVVTTGATLRAARAALLAAGAGSVVSLAVAATAAP